MNFLPPVAELNKALMLTSSFLCALQRISSLYYSNCTTKIISTWTYIFQYRYVHFLKTVHMYTDYRILHIREDQTVTSLDHKKCYDSQRSRPYKRRSNTFFTHKTPNTNVLKT